MVDVRKAVAEYREAAVRRQESAAREYFFDDSVPNRSSMQKRLSIYNWNPGPRRGKEGAVEKQIAGTLSPCRRRLIEFVDHELLTNRFTVIHYGGCAVLCCSTRIPFCPTSRSNPHHQPLCQETWNMKEAHPYNSCSDASRKCGPGCW